MSIITPRILGGSPMIITVGTITIPITPIMAMAGAVSAGALAWDLEWDGAWVFPSDTDTRTTDMVDMEDTMVTDTPIMDMEDTMAATMAATLITEVPTGVDITMDTIMDIMGGAVIIPKPIITAMGEWIADNMQVIPGPQRLRLVVQRELLQPIPGTGAAPAEQPVPPPRIQLLGATMLQAPSGRMPM